MQDYSTYHEPVSKLFAPLGEPGEQEKLCLSETQTRQFRARTASSAACPFYRPSKLQFYATSWPK